jgi:hypothetical protein
VNRLLNGRLLSYVKVLCCAAVVGNTVPLIKAVCEDYGRVTWLDLFVLATNLAALSAVAIGGKRFRLEFWAAFAAGALFIMFSSHGNTVYGILNLHSEKYNQANDNKNEMVLGAAKYEFCTCAECVSRYTDRVVAHHVETTRSVFGVCAAYLAGTVTSLLRFWGGKEGQKTAMRV